MNKVKEKLSTGQATLGGWIMTSSPAAAEVMAVCGFDWVAIDMEHTSVNYETIEHAMRAIQLHDCVPMVRVAAHDPTIIKRCLDVGAVGVVVPMVNTAEQARSVVTAARFPPHGSRGASFARAAIFGENFQQYYRTANDEVIVVAMVEDIESVKNIEQIVAVAGVDALFFGPYDLSKSMGIVGQFKHPDFVALVEKVKSAAARVKMPVGIHVIPPDPNEVRDRVNQGFQFIACSVDTQMILTLGKPLASALAASAGQ